MKRSICLVMCFCFISHLINAQRKRKKDIKREETVLGLNAIIADQNYYSKAVLEYKLVSEVIDGYSSITQRIPSDKPEYFLEPDFLNEITKDSFLIKNGKPTVTIFPDEKRSSQSDIESKSNRSRGIRDLLKELGVESCQFILPKEVDDLSSGFQFNHYYFKGSNKAAMQAFGIVDSEFNTESVYIVTDYIQYKDCKCTGIPTIRYAIGLRSEFKIASISGKTELSGVGSLAGLAAQAELENIKVDITVKTIGITGVESKLNIPNNTSFDVSTYKDYQNVIAFIKNFDGTEKKLNIHPEIIPVMDEYRTTLAHNFEPLIEKIRQLEYNIKKIEKKIRRRSTSKNSAIENTLTKLDSLKIKAIEDEVNRLLEERELLKKVDTRMNSYERYSEILKIIQGR